MASRSSGPVVHDRPPLAPPRDSTRPGPVRCGTTTRRRPSRRLENLVQRRRPFPRPGKVLSDQHGSFVVLRYFWDQVTERAPSVSHLRRRRTGRTQTGSEGTVWTRVCVPYSRGSGQGHPIGPNTFPLTHTRQSTESVPTMERGLVPDSFGAFPSVVVPPKVPLDQSSRVTP